MTQTLTRTTTQTSCNSPTRPLRIAIAGCGSIGRRHLRNLERLAIEREAEFEILAYDPVPEAMALVLADHLAVPVAHPDALWEARPDIALICTPSHLHTDFALAAARTGAALFIEKPLSHTLDGLTNLEQTVAASGATTLVGCNMRFHHGPAQLKRWLDAGEIGEMLSARLQTGSYLPNWRPHHNYLESYSASTEHGGAVLDCIHEIDLALWFGGSARLHAALSRPATCIGLQTEGLAELLLIHNSGAFSSVHLNFIQRNYTRRIEIVGTQGTLVWDFNAGEALLFGANGMVQKSSLQPTNRDINAMYLAELRYFLDCVTHSRPTGNPISDAIATLSIAIEARKQSMDTISSKEPDRCTSATC